jgi:predicted AlkP superfamily phosphohydrolase/phosphomutase
MRRGELAELRDGLARGMVTKTDISLDLLARERWDLFLVVYGESHCAGHQFWALHDPTWPGHDRGLVTRLGDPLASTYEGLDRELGRMLEAVDPDTPVLVLLSHGVGAHHDGDHLLGEIVRRLDLASGRPSIVRRASEIVRRRIERRRRDTTRRPTSVDGARRMFTIPNNELFGAVRVNLVGREPRGRVARGAELDELLGWLTERLLELEDADTGRSLVRRVLRVDEMYQGEHRDHLPDLLVDWARDLPITSARSPLVGVVRGSYQGIRSGDHRPSGLAALRAPGVEPGARSSPIDVVDLGPTIAARLGVELSDVDGRPLPFLLGPLGEATVPPVPRPVPTTSLPTTALGDPWPT